MKSKSQIIKEIKILRNQRSKTDSDVLRHMIIGKIDALNWVVEEEDESI